MEQTGAYAYLSSYSIRKTGYKVIEFQDSNGNSIDFSGQISKKYPITSNTTIKVIYEQNCGFDSFCN